MGIYLIDESMFRLSINPYIVIDDHGYDGKHMNGIIDLTDLTDKGVRQSLLLWALQARWIDYNID